MPIQITCPTCSASYKVPDDVAGKKIRCPKCNDAIIEVPASFDGGSGVGNDDPTIQAKQGSQADSQASNSPTETWQLKTPSGEIYGPVDKLELDQWVTEGRINAQTQLMQSDSQVWQSATMVFPHLANTASSTSAQSEFAGQKDYQQPAHWVHPQNGMVRPDKANVVSILLTVGGGIAIIVALIVLLSSGCMACWVIYNIVAGILSLIFGIMSFSTHRGMYGKLMTASILLMICIIGCDVVSLALGIVAMVMLSDEQTKRYFS